MKRMIICLLLFAVVMLSSCEKAEPSVPGENAPTMMQETEEAAKTTSTGDGPHIISIVDRSETEQLDVATAEEVFWEDERNRYIFPNIISHHVIVTYSDGSTEPIVDALEAGRAGISDLDRFGINYSAEEKYINPDLQSITDKSNAEIATEEIELIYEDDNFRYFLPEGLGKHIMVTYKDGTEESICDALLSDRITVQDLDQFEISYTRIEKYMAVMQRDGKEEFPLPDEARQTVEEILSGQEWIDTVPNCRSDIILSTGLGYLDYHTDCGTFTYLPNMTCCTVSEEERRQLMDLFSQYIPIA